MSTNNGYREMTQEQKDAYVAKTSARLKRVRKERLEYTDAIKLAAGCSDCGYAEHPQALDFDHLPGVEKLGSVSQSTILLGSVEKLMNEIEKCEVVCANCHRIRTAERRER